jgi:hypothetical protein
MELECELAHSKVELMRVKSTLKEYQSISTADQDDDGQKEIVIHSFAQVSETSDEYIESVGVAKEMLTRQRHKHEEEIQALEVYYSRVLE